MFHMTEKTKKGGPTCVLSEKQKPCAKKFGKTQKATGSLTKKNPKQRK